MVEPPCLIDLAVPKNNLQCRFCRATYKALCGRALQGFGVFCFPKNTLSCFFLSSRAWSKKTRRCYLLPVGPARIRGDSYTATKAHETGHTHRVCISCGAASIE